MKEMEGTAGNNGTQGSEGMKDGTSGAGGVFTMAKRARIRVQWFKGRGGSYEKIHVAEGVMAATDGRILLHVEDAGIHREEGDGDSKGILGVSGSVEGAEKVGGAEWCRGSLREVAFRLTKEAQEEAAVENRCRRREIQDARRRCPHCGEEVYEWGERLLTEEQMEEEEELDAWRPIDRNKTVAIVLADGRRRIFNAVYLDMAMLCDIEFGGLEGLWFRGNSEAVFRGEGWFVVVMSIRDDERFPIEATATVAAEGAGGTAAARQDGDGEGAEKGGEG